MTADWKSPLGDKRVKEKFFLFSKRINKIRKWGWQKVRQVCDLDDQESMLQQRPVYIWRDIEWVDSLWNG